MISEIREMFELLNKQFDLMAETGVPIIRMMDEMHRLVHTRSNVTHEDVNRVCLNGKIELPYNATDEEITLIATESLAIMQKVKNMVGDQITSVDTAQKAGDIVNMVFDNFSIELSK